MSAVSISGLVGWGEETTSERDADQYAENGEDRQRERGCSKLSP